MYRQKLLRLMPGESASKKRAAGEYIDRSSSIMINQSMIIRLSRRTLLFLLHKDIPLALVDSENQIHLKQ
jgi:hypothetical protein